MFWDRQVHFIQLLLLSPSKLVHARKERVARVRIDTVCDLSSFRRFMIVSTCDSFIPDEYVSDENVFPERASDQGTMYLEAEDKETLEQIRDIRFTRVSNVLGIIYNSKSGRTHLKWREFKGDLGRLAGEASTNTIVNLSTAGALDEKYVRKYGRQAQEQTAGEQEQPDY